MELFKQIRISKELMDKIKLASKITGLTDSAWIRVAIAEKLKRGEL